MASILALLRNGTFKSIRCCKVSVASKSDISLQLFATSSQTKGLHQLTGDVLPDTCGSNQRMRVKSLRQKALVVENSQHGLERSRRYSSLSDSSLAPRNASFCRYCLEQNCVSGK